MVNVKRLKFFYESNEEKIKRAAVVLVIIAALLVYLFSTADKNEIAVSEDGQIISEQGVDSSTTDGGGSSSYIYVDISGEVISPGVYQVQSGARLFEVIKMAGGLTKNADLDALNQAESLVDGQKITILGSIGADTSGEVSNGASSGMSGISANGKININLADSITLQEITGVGPVTAEKIIDYRTTKGRFKSIEDLKNVSGIGDKTFEKIKGEVTV